MEQQQQQQSHAMQYKNVVHSSASMSLPKNNSILRNVCFLTEEDELNLVHSNIKAVRQTSKEHTIAPKKNLPHKKRITKKLKSISPNVDHMQAVESAYHSHHHDIAHLQSHTEHSFSMSSHQQNETLNLTLSQQPIQLTTPRVAHHNQPADSNHTEFMASEHFSTAQSGTVHSVHSVQLQQIPGLITDQQQHAPRFTCEICGMQSHTQLGFFHHLKFEHYEPESVTHAQNCKIESIRSVHNAGNMTTSLNLEQSNQNLFEMNDERKMNGISDQTLNQPVIMTDNFVRLQNNEQDFSCISGIGNEDVTDDESMNGYNDTGLNGIKSEQNEFSDTEDMLENGVLDKVQRVVDSYLENGTSDVKSLIDMNENQHHSSLVNDTCDWTDNAHALTTAANSVYGIEKNESVNNMTASNFVITSNNPSKDQPQTQQTHIISNQPVIERPEELTLIYEINVNDKDFPIMDDTSTESEFFLLI